jgi:Ca-activated chloride channel family protein
MRTLGLALLAAALCAAQEPGPIEPPVQTTTPPKPITKKARSKAVSPTPADAATPAATPQSAPQTAPPAAAAAAPPAPQAAVPFKPDLSEAQAETPTFRSDVRLVRMLATVRDAQGAIVGSLKRDEFRLVDDGVEQEIAVFESTTEQPLSVALLIDCSRSTQREHRTELDSVRGFVRALFQSGNARDSASLYSFNADVTQESPWTRSPGQVERALARLQSEGATALYDAIRLGTQDLAPRDGRHVVVIVSDGEDTFSRSNFQQALEAAHAADAILYSVVIQPVLAEAGRNTGGENALITFSNSTGGKTFFPASNKEMDEDFAAILRELRTQYLVAFYPRGLAPSKDRFHQVRLALRRSGYVVDARRGYFDPPPSTGFSTRPKPR